MVRTASEADAATRRSIIFSEPSQISYSTSQEVSTAQMLSQVLPEEQALSTLSELTKVSTVTMA